MTKIFLPCSETSKFSASWYYRFGCAYPDMLEVRKIRSLHVFAISPEKHRDEVVLLPTDKHENFLQGATIILGLFNQACPNYPK